MGSTADIHDVSREKKIKRPSGSCCVRTEVTSPVTQQPTGSTRGFLDCATLGTTNIIFPCSTFMAIFVRRPTIIISKKSKAIIQCKVSHLYEQNKPLHSCRRRTRLDKKKKG